MAVLRASDSARDHSCCSLGPNRVLGTEARSAACKCSTGYIIAVSSPPEILKCSLNFT